MKKIVPQKIENSYELAREVYAEYGVDTDAVLREMAGTTLSLHCWQGDDVTGFEAGKEGLSDGGILATGNYPGKARNGEELRADLEFALSLRCEAFHRVYLALDFFDASINRITAWVTGARATLKAILLARLEPTALLRAAEANGDYGTRLALMEEFKTLPFTAVWHKYCLEQNVPVGAAWLAQVKDYEKQILAKRS